ncbi:MAG TPA: stalk domain-containing protein [Symbiobacteriaceae bacterium]|nr:stalk domain-containing protein [Symbiobacteriaceae bacterium]
MRRFLAALAALLSIAALFPAGARAAVTSQEWNWIVTARDKENAGDLEGAMALWMKLVDSLRSHDLEACGHYARKLGQALDERGRLTEAIAAYDAEIECWSQLSDPSFAEGMLPHVRRAEQLRPEIRAFVARPADGAPAVKLAKHEPAFGTLLGGALDLDPAVGGDPSRVAAAYGKPYAMSLVYVRWNDSARRVAGTAIWQKSPSLQVAWEPDEGLAAVQDGPYLRDFARELEAFGRPVFLRFGGEMNGAWTAWHGDPALYRQKFALVARIMREEAPNVAMVWSPNFVGDQDYNLYYPGDAYVDWVGINGYTDPYFRGDVNSLQKDADMFYQGKRANPVDKFRAIYNLYSPRKPIMIAETGFGWANRSPHRDEAAWAAEAMERFYGYLPLIFPRMKAVAYFNVDVRLRPQVPSASHYVLSGSDVLTETYRRVTADDWYLGSMGGARSFWRPMEQATLLGPTQVAAYVNLPAGVGRVAYLLDGVQKAAATRLPWAANLDLTGLTGPRTLTVVAYDKDGREGVRRNYSFDASAIRVKLNGRYIDFDQPPVILDNRTLVPARAILEALGAEIAWDGATETVTAVRGGSVLKLQIGNPVPTLDGKPLKALDVPARILGGRTLVPVRFVSENYHMDVKWEPETQTVVITPKQ